MRIQSTHSAVAAVILSAVSLLATCGSSAQAQISLTAGSNQHTENFDTLAVTGTTKASYANNTTILGLYSLIGRGPIGTGAATYTPETYNVQNGTSPSGGIASFGSTGSPERAFGSVVMDATTGPDTGFITYGFRFVNSDSIHSITQFTLSYRGEQWRRNTETSQTVAFSYAVFESEMGGLDMPTGYTADTDLDFTSPGGTTAPGPLFTAIKTDTITATVRPGQELWVRWVDTNEVGLDHNNGIDNFSLNAAFDPTPAPPGFVTGLIGSATFGLPLAVRRWRVSRRRRK